MRYIPIPFFLPSEPCSIEEQKTILIVLIIAILVLVGLIIKEISEIK